MLFQMLELVRQRRLGQIEQGGRGRAAIEQQLAASSAAVAARKTSPRIHNALVQKKLAQRSAADTERASGFAQRIEKQQARFQLPAFPTTTIGSFPQTAAIRQARAAYKRSEIGHLDYLEQMRAEIRIVVEKQEQLGLDVLVHGEAERSDMVEYFGESCGVTRLPPTVGCKATARVASNLSSFTATFIGQKR